MKVCQIPAKSEITKPPFILGFSSPKMIPNDPCQYQSARFLKADLIPSAADFSLQCDDLPYPSAFLNKPVCAL